MYCLWRSFHGTASPVNGSFAIKVYGLNTKGTEHETALGDVRNESDGYIPKGDLHSRPNQYVRRRYVIQQSRELIHTSTGDTDIENPASAVICFLEGHVP